MWLWSLRAANVAVPLVPKATLNCVPASERPVPALKRIVVNAVREAGRNSAEVRPVQPRLTDMIVIAARRRGGRAVGAEVDAELVARERQSRARRVAIGVAGGDAGDVCPVQPRLADVVVI